MGKITSYSLFPLAVLSLWWMRGTDATATLLQQGTHPDIALPKQQDFSADLQIRLPAELPIPQTGAHNVDRLEPSLSSYWEGHSLALDFSSCDISDQCISGQITTEHLTPAAQTRFQQYHAEGSPITLAPDIRGYWLNQDAATDEGIAPSVMWQQDEQLYTVYLPAAERQEVLYFAHSVANSSPITQQYLQEKIENQQRLIEEHARTEQTLSEIHHSEIHDSEIHDSETTRLGPLRIDAVEISPDLHLATEIESLVSPLVDQEITPENLALVANSISQQYQSQGFLTSGAIVTAAEITEELQGSNTLVIGRGDSTGITVREDVITPAEISVSDVDENPLSPGAEHYIQSRLSLALRENEPVHFDQLEDQLRLLREDPIFENIEANLTSLSAGQENQPRLAVRATQAETFALGFRIDNGSPISTGGEQAAVNMSQRNLFRFGDQLSSAYNISSTAGLRKYAFGYQLPLNAMNGSLRIGVDSTSSEITQKPFDTLGIRGSSQQYSVRFRQPLVRSPREEFALSFGLTHTRGQTFLFNDLAQPFGIGPDLDGRSRVSTLTFGQQYLNRDSQGAWSFNSEFNLGVDWLGATVNKEPVPDGRFFSWLGQAQRSQRVGDNHLLIMQADLQLTPDSLLPSEQFVIGGAGSVRGYRQNLRSGDSGFRLSVEDRVAVVHDSAGRPEVFITPFLEAGKVWQSGGNPNPLPEQTLLMSTGVGLLWENAFTLSDLNLRIDYGLPLIQLTDRSNNLQDSAIHFSVDYDI